MPWTESARREYRRRSSRYAHLANDPVKSAANRIAEVAG